MDPQSNRTEKLKYIMKERVYWGLPTVPHMHDTKQGGRRTRVDHSFNLQNDARDRGVGTGDEYIEPFTTIRDSGKIILCVVLNDEVLYKIFYLTKYVDIFNSDLSVKSFT